MPPVIAISANAMEGDAERYISLGMDDYISKPVNEEILFKKLFTWLNIEFKETNKNTNNFPAMQNNNNFEEYPLINEDTLKTINEQSGGDADFLIMLFESFISDSDELISDIETANSTNNYKLMKEAIHSLKGLAGTIGASRLHEITKLMDKNLKNENIADATKFIPQVNSVYKEFKKHITETYLK